MSFITFFLYSSSVASCSFTALTLSESLSPSLSANILSLLSTSFAEILLASICSLLAEIFCDELSISDSNLSISADRLSAVVLKPLTLITKAVTSSRSLSCLLRNSSICFCLLSFCSLATARLVFISSSSSPTLSMDSVISAIRAVSLSKTYFNAI